MAQKVANSRKSPGGGGGMCGRGGGQGKDDCRPRVVGEGQEGLKGDNGGESHRGKCGSEGWRREDDPETIPFIKEDTGLPLKVSMTTFALHK